MYPVRLDFPSDAIENVPNAVDEALDAAVPAVQRGSSIAVAVGSRGIGSLADIVGSAVRWLKSRGADPFIVPAMGSHGGATGPGQAEVLASYGVTEESMGVPIRSSMETVRLGNLPTADIPGGTTENRARVGVFMDRNAYEADGVLLINRVKPHTDFHRFPESGLMKMSVIGLGKHDQALAVHGHGIRGLKELILPASRRILASGKILGGLAIVENAYDRPMMIQAALADGIEAMERGLLPVAHDSMPKLPIEDIDLLIVDEIGKDVSGTCFDTNVIGRIRIAGEAEPPAPRIRSIMATRLTPASHGNAIGVGLADVITRELYDAIDFGATYENGLTSSFAERIKIPYVAPDHRAAVRAALRFAGLDPDPESALAKAKIVGIRNTLDLSHMLVSKAAAEDLAAAGESSAPNIEIAITNAAQPLFAATGALQQIMGLEGQAE